MKSYELYARFRVSDKGAKNNNVASLVVAVQECDGVVVKVQDYGDRSLARVPRKGNYSQALTSDACLKISMPPTRVADLKKLLRRGTISELLLFMIDLDPEENEKEENRGSAPTD